MAFLHRQKPVVFRGPFPGFFEQLFHVGCLATIVCGLQCVLKKAESKTFGIEIPLWPTRRPVFKSFADHFGYSNSAVCVAALELSIAAAAAAIATARRSFNSPTPRLKPATAA